MEHPLQAGLFRSCRIFFVIPGHVFCVRKAKSFKFGSGKSSGTVEDVAQLKFLQGFTKLSDVLRRECRTESVVLPWPRWQLLPCHQENKVCRECAV